MATFDFSHPDRFTSTSTSIRRPRELTYFSYDDQHVLKPLSTQSLSYYYPPFFHAPGTVPPRIDLSAGFKTFKQRDDAVDEHLDGLVETLQAHEEELMERVKGGEEKVEDVRVKADVITWRGMMTKILVAAFDDFGDFEMSATNFQGTIFIEENHSYKEAQKQAQNAQQPRRGQAPQEMMQYWGYKFETLSVLPKPWSEVTRDDIEARESHIVNNHAQYCSIVRTGIGTTSLVIGGEVDAVLGEKPESSDDPIPWVELKTSQEPRFDNPREIIKYERKLLKYWAQSFLLGVPRIVVGYRSQDGFLTRISELETQKIPGMVKRGQHVWDGNVCINFTGAFLEFLKQVVVGEGVWTIRRRRNARQIEVLKSEESGTGMILKDSFKAHREKLRALEISAALG